jgi:hypothetical protein
MGRKKFFIVVTGFALLRRYMPGARHGSFHHAVRLRAMPFDVGTGWLYSRGNVRSSESSPVQ